MNPFTLTKKLTAYLGVKMLRLSDRIPIGPPNIMKRVKLGTKKINATDDGKWINFECQGIRWLLDPKQWIDRSIIKHGVFEEDSIYWVRDILRPGMTVIDVGANFGYYTINMSKWVGETGIVYAFEPSKFFRDRLAAHAKLNSCDNCTIIDFGLSDHNTSTELYKLGDSACLNWYDERSEPDSVEKVCLRRLDDVVEEFGILSVDFIKVDIDGHEPKFLSGAYETIKKFKPILQMEFQELALLQNNSDVEQLADELSRLGYVLYSERNRKKITNRTELLIETKNCAYSVNIFCFPNTY